MTSGALPRGPSLGDDVITVAKPYLGLATRDLLTRTSRTMVGVELELIDAAQLDSLAYWTRIAAMKLMPERRANELAERIRALARP